MKSLIFLADGDKWTRPSITPYRSGHGIAAAEEDVGRRRADPFGEGGAGEAAGFDVGDV